MPAGWLLVATETTVINEDGVAVMGSEDVFLKKRAKGTERADKASPNKGVEKFFGTMPTWDNFDGPTNVDAVIVPAIDGNYDGVTTELGAFEAQFQTLHSLQNYFLLNELLAPGHVMPMVDTEAASCQECRLCGPFSGTTSVLHDPCGQPAGAAR